MQRAKKKKENGKERRNLFIGYGLMSNTNEYTNSRFNKIFLMLRNHCQW